MDNLKKFNYQRLLRPSLNFDKIMETRNEIHSTINVISSDPLRLPEKVNCHCWKRDQKDP